MYGEKGLVVRAVERVRESQGLVEGCILCRQGGNHFSSFQTTFDENVRLSNCTSAMSKSTSFSRKLSICSLNFFITASFPAPDEYKDDVWQIHPATNAPPSLATPLAMSQAA